MPPLRAQVFERLQLGPETTEGTAVQTSRRPLGLGMQFAPSLLTEPIMEVGNKAPVGMQVFKENVEGSYSGSFGYNEWIYILNSLLTKGVITTPTTNGIWNLAVSATGGTFTITVVGSGTTAAITVTTLSATNIRTALELIVGTGNVTVTAIAGGYRLNFLNRFKRTASITIDDGLATGGTVDETTTAGTLSRLWTFTPSHFDPDDPQFYTFATGSVNEGARAAGGVFRTASWEARPRQSINVTGNIIAQLLQQGYLVQNLYFLGAPSGGTFKVSYKTVESAAITYGAGLTAATVQAALELVSTIGVGNVEVIGANGGPFTVALIGDLWDDDASALSVTTPSFTGGSTPTGNFGYVMTGLTVTDVRTVPVEARNVGIWLGATLDTLSQLTNCQGIRHDVGERFAPVFTIDDRERSYSGTVEEAGSPTFQITVDQGSAVDNYIQQLRRNETKYLRIAAEGPLIEAGYPYRIECLAAVNIREPAFSEVDGAASATYTLQCIYDATLGTYLKWFVQSALTAL